MSKKFALLAVVLLLASLALAACGGSGSGSSGGGNTSISSTMTDFKFEPTSWSVPAGKTITLKLTNSGAVEHTWVLMKSPVTPPAPQGGSDVIFQAKVQPGQTQSFTFTAPSAPGDYEVICDVPGHLEAGMAGKLTVTQ
jgi:uncharacterized cupredoxin-like copper-binding protein